MAWKKAYALGLELYAATRSFPPSEAFGLIGQLRRAGVSVSSNIAEGRGRDSKRDFIRFLNVANGSLAEIDTQLRFAADLDYLPPGQAGMLLHRVDECARLIRALSVALQRSLAAERSDRGSRRARTAKSTQGLEIHVESDHSPAPTPTQEFAPRRAPNDAFRSTPDSHVLSPKS